MANLEAMTGGGSNSCMSSGELRIDKASESSISTSGSLSSADISVKSSLSSCITGTSSVKSSSVSGKMSDSAISDSRASRKTGEIVDSVKTSLSRVSSSSSTVSDSNESICSSFSSGHKPHKGKDRRWESVLAAQMKDGALGLSHFRLLKRLGCGDIGSVYLCELRATDSYFAMKVMDKCALASRKKLLRVQTEREILQMLDHPFLPTLYAHFETDKFSCLVMEFCPGGDLHVLRQRQAGKYFPEHVARFYAAEVLLALEYLHMMGIVYRDLKPENVLVREDGHVMLSDFDLSLRCVVNPMLVKSSFSEMDPSKRAMVYCAQPACLEPTCIPPPCVAPACFVSKLLPSKPKKVQKPKNVVDNRVPELIAEPTGAQSMSFVGTHEYLAPEIIKGEGHGSAVDWWTFGIFLYELLHGRTPYKGDANRATLLNVIGQPLRFPQAPSVSYGARDLIRGLLVKDPQHRLAYRRGATEIKQHPFFEGINWALIRSMRPPEIPRRFDLELARSQSAHQHGSVGKNQDDGSSMPYLDFEFF